MSRWRKRLFILILVALLVITIVFWGTMAGGCAIFALILSIQAYVVGGYASSELAETFNEDGKNVEGWRD